MQLQVSIQWVYNTLIKQNKKDKQACIKFKILCTWFFCKTKSKHVFSHLIFTSDIDFFILIHNLVIYIQITLKSFLFNNKYKQPFFILNYTKEINSFKLKINQNNIFIFCPNFYQFSSFKTEHNFSIFCINISFPIWSIQSWILVIISLVFAYTHIE